MQSFMSPFGFPQSKGIMMGIQLASALCKLVLIFFEIRCTRSEQFRSLMRANSSLQVRGMRYIDDIRLAVLFDARVDTDTVLAIARQIIALVYRKLPLKEDHVNPVTGMNVLPCGTKLGWCPHIKPYLAEVLYPSHRVVKSLQHWSSYSSEVSKAGVLKSALAKIVFMSSHHCLRTWCIWQYINMAHSVAGWPWPTVEEVTRKWLKSHYGGQSSEIWKQILAYEHLSLIDQSDGFRNSTISDWVVFF